MLSSLRPRILACLLACLRAMRDSETRNPKPNLHSFGCQDDADCIKTLGSFECDCHSGFEGAGAEETCDDIDECDTGTHTCDVSTRSAWMHLAAPCFLGWMVWFDVIAG